MDIQLFHSNCPILIFNLGAEKFHACLVALFHIYKPQLDAKDVQSEPLNQLPVIRTSADSTAFPAKSVLCLWLLTFGPFYIFSIAIGLRFFILPTP